MAFEMSQKFPTASLVITTVQQPSYRTTGGNPEDLFGGRGGVGWGAAVNRLLYSSVEPSLVSGILIPQCSVESSVFRGMLIPQCSVESSVVRGTLIPQCSVESSVVRGMLIPQCSVESSVVKGITILHCRTVPCTS